MVTAMGVVRPCLVLEAERIVAGRAHAQLFAPMTVARL